MRRYDPEAFQNRSILFRVDTIQIISIARMSKDGSKKEFKEVARETIGSQVFDDGASLQSMAVFLAGLDEPKVEDYLYTEKEEPVHKGEIGRPIKGVD